ncbi:hypothetical protein L1987_86997 [Smallanthus sonchifolius]|uniref:Uncharacterized protein n=1 Tax=Smallanthus sonchifolius TaxID=185202 RepID=A0ACB8Y115_9ASTR|nr:hypothetical protein L1987_86997 [Smallanthus sonchifolius]
MDGMGRGLVLRVHGHSMHGDALTLASFDVIPDWVGDEFFWSSLEKWGRGESAWVRFNTKPVAIIWPEVWGQEECEKSLTHAWEDLMKVVKISGDSNHGRDLIEKDLTLFYMGINQAKDNVTNFFEKDDMMVEYLAKWKGSHELNDQEAWRKMSGTTNQNARWLDVERDACQVEEAKQRKKKKKRKLKGDNPFKDRTQDLEQRRKIKVWSSKNCNPLKNMFMQKVNFMQNFVPSRPTITQFGFSKFKVGHTRGKDCPNRLTPKESMVSRTDRLYAELVAKEARLKDIAININKTDKNATLLNSILGMQSCNLRSGNNHRSNNIQEGRRRYNTDSHAHSNGRTGNTGMMNLYERNIVHNQNMEKVTGNSGVRRENENMGNTSGNKTTPPISRPQDQRTMGARTKAPGKEIKDTNPKYRVVETTNRFSHLDTDGNELENGIEGMETVTNQMNKPCNGNDGWIKKQERTLNTKYSKDITQEQRFEAKRYIIDQLVPLENVLLGWSSPQLQYFRHLCSIHNFGLGYVATNREGDEDRSDVDMGMDVENIEEVESKTEGAAMMMKDDDPKETTSKNQNKNDQNPCIPNQRDVDMLHAGTETMDCQ